MKQLFHSLKHIVLALCLLLGVTWANVAVGAEVPFMPPKAVVVEAEMPLLPEKTVAYFGSAGNVTRGFKAFNEDCLSPRANPNDRQIMHVATSTNSIMELGWGDWSSEKSRQNIADCKVKRLIEAKAMDKNSAIVSVDFILWDDSKPTDFRYRGDSVVIPELTRFFKQLVDNDVVGMVKKGMCYIQDEPALYGITEEEMVSAIRAVRESAKAVKELGVCRTFVIYNYGQYPGISHVDVAGQDNYDMGAGILSDSVHEHFRSMLRPITDPNPQWIMLVPGGAFKQDPHPFFEKAKHDPQVIGVIGFIYFDEWNDGKLGIHGNGMAKAYCTEGKKMIHPEVEEPDCVSLPPTVSLTVNGTKHVTVDVEKDLCYAWNSHDVTEKSDIVPKNFHTSYWWSSNPSCAFGLNGGKWSAGSESGGYCWPAHFAQAGCTYTITYVGCGQGMICAADSVSVTVNKNETK